MKSIYGYFDNPYESEPSYDPGFDVLCPVCNSQLSNPVITISLALYDVSLRDRSYFFFISHQDCWKSLTEEEKPL